MTETAQTPHAPIELPPIELLVCTKCRVRDQDPAGEIRPGTQLHAALSQHDLPANITLRAVECLSNCTSGCSVALRGPGRWSYVYGNFDETNDAPMIADVTARYHAAPDGLVPWRERPVHFRKNCIARIPPTGET